MIRCKLGDHGCFEDGWCRYVKYCENQITDDSVESTATPTVVRVGKWSFNADCDCYVCSKCSCSALNDYAGRSTPSSFCPNCGEPMFVEGSVYASE